MDALYYKARMDNLYYKAFDIITGAYVRLKGMRPANTCKVTQNLYAIKTGVVNFYLYKRDGTVIALDTGFNAKIITRELCSIGISPDSISAVFLSHTDFDHAGGISVFANASIYLSHDEEQMIRHVDVNTKPSPRARKYGFIYNRKITRPYRLLNDNEEVSIGAVKVRAIETPGHTPGSMSYILDNTILFSGDAFKVSDGTIQPIGAFYNIDHEEHIQSIRKLAKLEGIELVLTGHRGYLYSFGAATEYWR